MRPSHTAVFHFAFARSRYDFLLGVVEQPLVHVRFPPEIRVSVPCNVGESPPFTSNFAGTVNISKLTIQMIISRRIHPLQMRLAELYTSQFNSRHPCNETLKRQSKGIRPTDEAALPFVSNRDTHPHWEKDPDVGRLLGIYAFCCLTHGQSNLAKGTAVNSGNSCIG